MILPIKNLTGFLCSALSFHNKVSWLYQLYIWPFLVCWMFYLNIEEKAPLRNEKWDDRRVPGLYWCPCECERDWSSTHCSPPAVLSVWPHTLSLGAGTSLLVYKWYTNYVYVCSQHIHQNYWEINSKVKKFTEKGTWLVMW